MYDIDAALTGLRKMAKADPEIRLRLLDTKKAAEPLKEFCELSSELGFPLSVMDLIDAGEQYYANMRRSTNGGGENSPLLAGEDDYYSLFMAELE